MDRIKELKEVKQVAEKVLAKIDHGISSLNSASSWGIFDMIGGGLISSLMKRNKIQSANEDIREIVTSLMELNKELKDVDMYLPAEISDTITDNVLDVWFDNIFTDIRVQGEIKSMLQQLHEFRSGVVDLIHKVESEIQSLEK